MKAYSNLDNSFKDLLIEYSESSELIADLVEKLELFGKLSNEAVISNNE